MGLTRLDLAITSECNLRCKHCYQGKVKKGRISLSLKEIQNIFSDAQYLGVQELTITGGEPLRHPDFLKIMRIAGDMGMKIRLLTNATLITFDMAQRLAGYGPDAQISLDGPKSVHERIRGIGSWGKTVQAIQLLVANKIKVIINAQLTEGILEDVEDYIDFLESLGVSEVIFSITGLFGDAREYLVDTPTEYFSAIKELFAEDITDQEPVEQMSHCGALAWRIAVNYDGVVYPCDFFKSIAHYSLGNIYSESLIEICETWQKSNCALMQCYSKGIEECNPMYCMLFGKPHSCKEAPLSKLVFGRI